MPSRTFTIAELRDLTITGDHDPDWWSGSRIRHWQDHGTRLNVIVEVDQRFWELVLTHSPEGWSDNNLLLEMAGPFPVRHDYLALPVEAHEVEPYTVTAYRRIVNPGEPS